MTNVPFVRDVMTTTLVLLKEDMQIHEAINMLLRKKFSGAPVVDKERNLVGMLSEKDCLRLFTNMALNQFPGGDVKHYMSTDIITISPEEGIFTAASTFMEHSFRRLPVMDHGKLVGVISRTDVLEGSRHVWESMFKEKSWTDATYLTDQIKAALK